MKDDNEMFTRGAMITGSAASLLLPQALLAGTVATDRQAAIDAALQRPETLAYHAAKSGRLFGTMLVSDFLNDSKYIDAIARECSLIYPARMGTHATRQSQNGFYFSSADRVVAYAKSHNLALGGGYLVVHGDEPRWISPDTDRSAALAEMQLDINKTMTHFSGLMDHWIVVNEAINVSHKNKYGLRDCTWLSAIGGDVDAGTDYVSEAFKAARRTDPNAVLVLNENHLEGDLPYEARKREAVLSLLRTFKKNEIPIDAIGMQAHLRGDGHYSEKDHESFLDDVDALGLKIIVTELDVMDANLVSDITARDQAVARDVGNFLNILLRHKSVTAINVWGLSDDHSWYNQPATPAELRRRDQLASRSTVLDEELRRKPVYTAIQSAFEKARG